MPTYVTPQVRVFQEVNAEPQAAAATTRACLLGPSAELVRFDMLAERESGRLGYPDVDVDSEFLWPGLQPGAKIDADYTKVFVKKALLHYFAATVASDDIERSAGFSNRVVADTTRFGTNGAGVRSGAFKSRDVKPGDIARIRGLDSNDDPVTIWTVVKALHGNVTGSSFGVPTGFLTPAYPSNAPTQSKSGTLTLLAGSTSAIDEALDVDGYDGLASGYIAETYTIRVTQNSTGANLTTARLKVTSASGTDDADNVAPTHLGGGNYRVSIGARGAFLTLATEGGNLLQGVVWRAVVTQTHSADSGSSYFNGEYEGKVTKTYVAEIVRGGINNGDPVGAPLVKFYTTDGTEAGDPVALVGDNVELPVLASGLTFLAVDAGRYVKGDRFAVTAVPAGVGPLRQIEFNHSLAVIPANSDVSLDLFILRPTLELDWRKTQSAPEVNWEADDEKITIKAGYTAFDPSWTDDGVPVALPLFNESSLDYGETFVQYRAWIPRGGLDTVTVGSTSDLDLLPGPLHPDNPLKWAASKALTNSNGVTVRCVQVSDPDSLDAWADALDAIAEDDGVRSLVPLTHDRDVQDLIHANVTASSSPEASMWRTGWFSLPRLADIPIVHGGSSVPGFTVATTSDGDLCMGRVLSDNSSPGNPIRLVRIDSDNVDLFSLDVAVGDIVRVNFSNDGYGLPSWTEHKVASIRSATELTLDRPLATTIPVASKIEIWRKNDAEGETAAYERYVASWSDRRIRLILPSAVGSAGVTQPGYFLAAGLAGLASGVASNQGLTNVEIAGFDDTSELDRRYSKTQLDRLAAAGIWLVVTDRESGAIVSRHAVTSAPTDLASEREEMFTRNLDSISFELWSVLRSYIGKTNNVATVIDEIRLRLAAVIDRITQTTIGSIGPRATAMDLLEIAPHAVFKDRLVIRVSATLPFAINNIDLFVVA